MRYSIREISFFHKVLLFSFFTIFVAIVSFFLLPRTSNAFAPLYPLEKLSAEDIGEVRSYLSYQKIPFEEHKEGGFWVPKEIASQVRQNLAARGLFKENEKKGFELFDSATWIKGEKELQVLEMRALKEQLEKDIASFEPIKSAHVILDLPPQRTLGAVLKPKASIILTLLPEAKLSATQLCAITNHLAGAVRGLEPQMIAISDTSGRLYQAIDPLNKRDFSLPLKVSLVEELESKIDTLIAKMVPKEHYHFDLHVDVNEGEVIEKIALLLWLDHEFETSAHLKGQIEALLNRYHPNIEIVMQKTTFCKKTPFWEEKEMTFWQALPKVTLFATLFFSTAFIGYLIFRNFPKKETKTPPKAPVDLQGVIKKVNLTTLSSLIKDEPPQTIASMLSYLEKERREALLSLLPTEVREEVMKHGV